MRWVLERLSKGIHLSDRIDFSIALLVTRPSEEVNCRTTLICTPVALLRQWFNEIRTKTQPPLNVYIHHASSRGKKAKSTADLMQYDVVLTTYTTIVNSLLKFISP
jgi:SNF2 family DNA or RNA helicase